jgi:hypothetical protein
MWTKPIIIYSLLAGTAISAGFAFGAVFAFAGFVSITVLAFVSA